jgi:hypothetical protein
MPTDKQRLDLLRDEKLGELFGCGGNVAQLSSEVSTRIAVETACTGMNVNVNGSHGGWRLRYRPTKPTLSVA